MNSKKTHSEGVYYITIFGNSSRDNTKKSKQRELSVNNCLLCSLLLGFAEVEYFSSEFLLCSYRSPFINYPKEFSNVLVELTFYSNRLVIANTKENSYSFFKKNNLNTHVSVKTSAFIKTCMLLTLNIPVSVKSGNGEISISENFILLMQGG